MGNRTVRREMTYKVSGALGGALDDLATAASWAVRLSVRRG